MNPFFVLDLDLDASDDDVAKRYRELIECYPPDQHPELFAEVRAAYEALRGPQDRLKTWLFWFDRFGRDLVGTEMMLRGAKERPRITPFELAAALRSVTNEDDHE